MRQSRRIDSSQNVGMRSHGVWLGCERNSTAAKPSEEKGLFAEPVACDEKGLALRVPQREREHSNQPLQGVGAPLLHGRQHDLGVAIRRERVTEILQRASKLAEVVNLPVENKDNSPACIVHGLIGGRTQVKDREAAMTQADWGVDDNSLSVRTSMCQRTNHPRQQALIRTCARTSYHACDTTHRDVLLEALNGEGYCERGS